MTKDTIHKKKKDWPHFTKFYVSSEAYSEGYDRIFGKKKEGSNGTKEVNETRRRRKIQKVGRKVAQKRRQES